MTGRLYWLLGALALCGCALPIETPSGPPGLPHFLVVVPGQRGSGRAGIYRSGQPTPPGYELIRAMGIDRVLQLDEGQAPAIPGVAVLEFPIAWWAQTVLRPNDRELHRIVGLIRAPCLVHCLNGNDRTGLVIALYRLACGWTKAAAEEEMLANGFHPAELGLWVYWQAQRAENWRL